jgi:Zn-dependent protease
MDKQENPFAYKPGQRVISLGKIFGTPLGLQGANWLPVNQVFFWALFTWRSKRDRPSWSGYQHMILGGLKMAVLLGSEWCHNLAHVAAARLVGKPVDAIRIFFGMPVLLYDEPEHPSITPRQHIIRSLAGPICNLILLLVGKLFQRLTPPSSPAREIVDTAVGMNSFIASAALVPIPAFDGGPIVKWSLIARGYSPDKAKAITTRLDQVVGAILLGSATVAMRKGRWLLALILSFLGMLSLATGFGKIKG